MPKIVGLDPALPLFSYDDVENRLADTDASYVEVIYTCAGMLSFTEPIGHSNFYPNGGKKQPGCGWDMIGKCAHGRAYEFYIESIYTSHFIAFQCDSLKNLQKGNCTIVNQVLQMAGEPGIKKLKDNQKNGIFYLRTNDKPRFGLGINGALEMIQAATKKSMKKIMKHFNGI